MDIFPLDLVPDDEQTRLEQLKRVRQCSCAYKEAYLLPDGACQNFVDLCKLRRFHSANTRFIMHVYGRMVDTDLL